MQTIEKIIEILQLEPHPEGGYYREVYRSEGLIKKRCLGPEFSGERNFATSIYYLLDGNSFSAFHKIVQDETWHFYDGSPLALHMITELGYHIEIIMGREIEIGQVPQYTVPGGTWFAAKPVKPESYSLFGCTVSPGFTFADFKLAERNELISRFPQFRDLILELTWQVIS